MPLVTIHGGPAWGHSYLLPLKQLACRGRPVLFYDQVGCGESEHSTADWLFTTDYYVEELEALIAHLGWTKYHVLGSSWGTMVAQEFALKQPKGLDPKMVKTPKSIT